MEISRFWELNTTGDGILGPYSEATDVAEVLGTISGTFVSTDKGGVSKSELNELAVTGTATPVSVATGRALVYGGFYENNTSPVAVTVPTPLGATRIDRIVLRKDWLAETIRVYRIAGQEGGGAPALTQTKNNVWDYPLAQISTTTGGVVTVTDQRTYIPSTNIPSIPVIVAQGGTGDTTLTAHATLVGEGTSPIVGVGPGADHTVYQGHTGADPAWTATPTVTSLTTTGDLAVGGNETVAGTLTAGATTVSSLHDTGNATIDGNETVAGSLTAGATTVSSLHDTGNAQVDGNLTVTGTITGSSTTDAYAQLLALAATPGSAIRVNAKAAFDNAPGGDPQTAIHYWALYWLGYDTGTTP